MRSGRSISLAAAAIASLSLGVLAEPIRRRGGEDPMAPRYVRNARLNRSNKWKFARTYKEARALSPFPERPVR